MKKSLAVLALAGVLMAGGLAFAQDVQPPTPPEQGEAAPAPKKQTLWDIVKTGGWAMWPLGACSVCVVTLVIMDIRLVSRNNLIPAPVVASIRGAAEKGEVGQMYRLAKASPNLFTKGLIPGLRKLNPEDPAGSKAEMEGAIAESVGREEAQVGFWINFLSLITGVAPMIGLLGTVSGMIGAFQKIGMGGMGKPELLASNIGEALITTATGLCIAIPAMFAYFIFRNNLSRIVREAEAEYSAILDALTGGGDLFDGEAKADEGAKAE